MKLPKSLVPSVDQNGIIKSPPADSQLLPDVSEALLSTGTEPSSDSINPSANTIPVALGASARSPIPETSDVAPTPIKSLRNGQPSFLSTSLETQEELSEQLAQMGRQLRLNAIHLSNSIAKEKGTMEDAADKLDRNLGTMTKERVRLRDHRGKSGSTTWMVVSAIVCVIVAWILMFFVIRLT